MSRRRYISTKISSDTRINRLAREAGDFAALLYTWMIPHAEDDATLPDDPEELLLIVMPGRRDRDAADVAAAVEAMVDLGLLIRCNGKLAFPGPAFYRYQTYIGAARRGEEADQPRETPPPPDPETAAPQNSAEQRETPQNSAPRAHPRHSHSLSDSLSVSDSHSDRVGDAHASPSRPQAREEPPTEPGDSRKRAPDELFDAMVVWMDVEPAELTATSRSKINAALRELRAVNATPDELTRRGAEYSRRWPDIDRSPNGLATNWPKLARPQPAKQPRTTGHARDRPGLMSTVSGALDILNGHRPAEKDDDIIDVQRVPHSVAGHLAPPRPH